MTCTECGTDQGRIIRFKRKEPYCWVHYLQMNRHDRILTRTKYTPNEFIEGRDHAEIVLYRGEHEECARALVDLEDLARVRKFKWHLAKRKSKLYCETVQDRRSILLHFFVLGVEAGHEVDHRNANGLDCRKSNLRHLTHHQNILNTVTRAKSGRMGVFWRAGRSRWVATILAKGKRTSRSFDTFEEAVACRQEFERGLVGATVEELRRDV